MTELARAARRRLAILGLVLASTIIAVSTLTPTASPPGGITSPPFCLLCGDAVGSDVLLNIALFVPFGLAMFALGWPWRRCIAIALATTICIELLQVRIVSGRDASLRDVLSNTIGGSLGWWLGPFVRSMTLPTARGARRLAVCWLAVLATTSWVGAWCTIPSFTAMPWWGQFALFSRQGFKGRVIAAAIGDARLPIDSLSDSASRFLARELVRGEGVTASVFTAAPPAEPVHLLQIADRHSTTLVGLDQERADALFFVRLRASDIGLRSPRFRLRNAIPTVAGVVAHVSGWRGRAMIRLDVTGAGRERRVDRRVSAHWGWAMLAPTVYSIDDWEPYLTATWIALLVIPLGYWCTAAGGGPAGRLFAIPMFALAALAMLIVAPTTFGLSPGGVNEWLGVVAGGVIGRATWRSALSLAPPG